MEEGSAFSHTAKFPSVSRKSLELKTRENNSVKSHQNGSGNCELAIKGRWVSRRGGGVRGLETGVASEAVREREREEIDLERHNHDFRCCPTAEQQQWCDEGFLDRLCAGGCCGGAC